MAGGLDKIRPFTLTVKRCVNRFFRLSRELGPAAPGAQRLQVARGPRAGQELVELWQAGLPSVEVQQAGDNYPWFEISSVISGFG